MTTRANTTEIAIQQSDEMISQHIQNGTQQIEKQLDQYQALLQSKLSRLKQMNDQIQTAESQAQNKQIEKEIEPFEYGADFSSSYFNYSHYCARIYGEKQIQRDPNLEYNDQRETIQSRSSEQIRGQFEHQYMQTDRSKSQRLCILINEKQGRFGNGYYIPMGY